LRPVLGSVVAAGFVLNMASTVAVAAAGPTTTRLGSTVSTVVRPNGFRLGVSRTFADGALRFDPASASAKVIRSRAIALRTARRELDPGTKEPTAEVFFASYDLQTTDRVTGANATGTREAHTVWVVRFPGVDGRRKTGVILRNNLPTAVPVTTIALSVKTDILVVIDDVTGRVLLRSEYAAEGPA
jgi:hypothetical protein